MNANSPNNFTWNAWIDNASTQIPRGDAVCILLDAMGGETDASWLVLHGDEPISEQVQQAADRLTKKRASGMPLAYVLGYKYFYGRKFWLGKNPGEVLIPRPETEVVIDMVKRLRPDSVVDIGTGSGCIAITLALEMMGMYVAGVDISETALMVARENARRLGLTLATSRDNFGQDAPSLHLYHSDLMSNISSNYDAVVANLPYVDGEWDWLDKKALGYEPAGALFADDGGLSMIKRLITQATDRKVRHLFLEADPVQHEAIINFAKSYILVEKSGFWLNFRLR